MTLTLKDFENITSIKLTGVYKEETKIQKTCMITKQENSNRFKVISAIESCYSTKGPWVQNNKSIEDVNIVIHEWVN